MSFIDIKGKRINKEHIVMYRPYLYKHNDKVMVFAIEFTLVSKEMCIDFESEAIMYKTLHRIDNILQPKGIV